VVVLIAEFYCISVVDSMNSQQKDLLFETMNMQI